MENGIIVIMLGYNHSVNFISLNVKRFLTQLALNKTDSKSRKSKRKANMTILSICLFVLFSCLFVLRERGRENCHAIIIK